MPRSSKGLILHGIRTYNGTEEAEVQLFGSHGRAEVRKLNFISSAVKAGRKCKSGTSHLRKK